MARDAHDRSADLLSRWQNQGDREALDELLQIEIGLLKARMRRQRGHLGHPTASVSDVAQDVVLRVLEVEPAPHFNNPLAMRAYLWVSAQRLLFEHLRRRRGSTVPLDPTQMGRLDKALETTGGLSGVEERDHAAALNVVLHLLKPDEQEVLDLYYFRDLGIAGVASALGISHDAAKMRSVRARMSLAKKLVKWSETIG